MYQKIYGVGKIECDLFLFFVHLIFKFLCNRQKNNYAMNECIVDIYKKNFYFPFHPFVKIYK